MAAAAAAGQGVTRVVAAAVGIAPTAMLRIRVLPAAAGQAEARVGAPVEPRVPPGTRRAGRHDRATAAGPADLTRAAVVSETATSVAKVATATAVSVRVQGGTRRVLAAPPAVAAATCDEVRTGRLAHLAAAVTGPRTLAAGGSGPTGVPIAPVEGTTGARIGHPPAMNDDSRAAEAIRWPAAAIGDPRDRRPVTIAGPPGAAHRGAQSRPGTEVRQAMAGDPTRELPEVARVLTAAHDPRVPVPPADRTATRRGTPADRLVVGMIVTPVGPTPRADRIASPAGIVGRVLTDRRIVASAVLPGRRRPALPWQAQPGPGAEIMMVARRETGVVGLPVRDATSASPGRFPQACSPRTTSRPPPPTST